MITVDEAKSVLQSAECLYDQQQCEAAIRSMAASVVSELSESNPLVLVVMTGGLITAGHLLPLLDFPLEVDYLHATRYRGEITGTDIQWLARPQTSLFGRNILLVDDILDEGYTFAAILRWLDEQGVESVKTAVLVNKEHDRRVHNMQADVVGLNVPDRYVFGFGMDYKEYHRNAAGIYAVAQE